MTSICSPGQNTAVLLVDHQGRAMSWIRSAPLDQVKTNVLAPANGSAARSMPLVLTSSLREKTQGPLMPELRDIAAQRYQTWIRRCGTVNAVEDQDFATAVKPSDGRAWSSPESPTTSACIVCPTVSALRDGYRVQMVADAG